MARTVRPAAVLAATLAVALMLVMLSRQAASAHDPGRGDATTPTLTTDHHTPAPKVSKKPIKSHVQKPKPSPQPSKGKQPRSTPTPGATSTPGSTPPPAPATGQAPIAAPQDATPASPAAPHGAADGSNSGNLVSSGPLPGGTNAAPHPAPGTPNTHPGVSTGDKLPFSAPPTTSKRAAMLLFTIITFFGLALTGMIVGAGHRGRRAAR